MLQTRNAKRPAQAAVRFAVDAVEEGLLTREEAIETIDAASLDALLHPTFDREAEYGVLARGVAASPGAADLDIDLTKREVRVNGTVLHEGDLLAIDGTSGVVTTDDVPLVEPAVDEKFERVLKWADEL